MSRRLSPLIAAGSILTLVASLSAYLDEYVPLTRQELSKRFPLEKVFRCSPEGGRARAGTVSVEVSDGGIRLSGTDKHGRAWSWSADFEHRFLGCAIFRSDLDRNGEPDLLLLRGTGASSTHYPFTSDLTAFLFDRHGRPAPWEMEGYFSPADSETGIQDLLDLNGDGRAELLHMLPSVRDVYEFDETGYWITTLYEAKDGKWRQIRGRFAGRNYPIVRAHGRRLKPGSLPGNPLPVPDFSNAFSAVPASSRLP